MRIRAGWIPLLGWGLLVGCRSEQAVFSFRPLAYNAPSLSAKKPAHPARSTRRRVGLARESWAKGTAYAPAEATASLLANSSLSTSAAPGYQARFAQRGVGRVIAATPLAATAADPTLVAVDTPRLAADARPRRAGAAAEAGLGRTVLTLLAMVLGTLAGLAALLSLISGVSFWGGLGLAVGGLLVLGLLYKLLKGGGKKK